MKISHRFKQSAAKAAYFMGRSVVLLPVVMVIGAMVSAGQARAADQDENTADSSSLDDVQEHWSEAIESLKGYTISQRDAATEEAGAALEDIDEQIEVLQQRTVDEWGELSVEAREARLDALHELVEQREEMAKWYIDMKDSSEQAWAEVRAGFVDAYGVLEEAWADAAREFE